MTWDRPVVNCQCHFKALMNARESLAPDPVDECAKGAEILKHHARRVAVAFEMKDAVSIKVRAQAHNEHQRDSDKVKVGSRAKAYWYAEGSTGGGNVSAFCIFRDVSYLLETFMSGMR